MAKKILIGLGTLVLIALPYLTLAQFPKAQMSNCCELKHDIDTAAGWLEGDVVSEEAVGDDCYSKGQTLTVTDSTPDWGGVCTMDAVYTVTDFLFWIFLAFSVIMGVYIGVMFMTAGGNPSQMEKARSMVVYLVIGIVVAIAVKLIPSLARAVIGV